MGKITILLSAITISAIATAQPGSPDLTFGTGGKVVSAISNSDDSASAVLRLASGKIIAAGQSTSNQMAFAQYNNDGTPDTSFNGTGTLVYDFDSGNESVARMAEQADGKIIAVGHSSNTTVTKFAVLRLLPDGTPDPDFGNNGEVVIDFAQTYNRATCVLVQPDGKIVVGGLTDGAIIYKIALARLNADGTLDTTFSTDGKQTTILFGRSDYLTGIALQPDGKIVASGGTIIASGSNQGNFAVLRYLPDGNLDPSFSGDGYVNFFPAGSGITRDILLQPDGRIIVGGYAGVTGAGQDFAMARLLPDGALDDTFGVGGKVTTSVSTSNDWIFGMQLQPDGKIVAVGDASLTDTYYDFAVVRYQADGSLDTGFGTNGIVTTDFYDGLDRGFAGVFDGDNILVAGLAEQAASGQDFALMRYSLETGLSVIETERPLFVVYPNPSADFIRIENINVLNGNFSLIDITGKTVKQGRLSSDAVDIRGLSGGVYLLRVVSEKGTSALRLIKK